MTPRQAANHILAGILSLAEDKRSIASSMRSVGLDGDADYEEIAMKTLFDVAVSLKSAIDDGEYGE